MSGWAQQSVLSVELGMAWAYAGDADAIDSLIAFFLNEICRDHGHDAIWAHPTTSPAMQDSGQTILIAEDEVERMGLALIFFVSGSFH